MLMIPAINKIFLLLVILSLISFFGLDLKVQGLDYFVFALKWIIFLCPLFFYEKKQIYGKYILLLNLFLLVNVVGCYVNRGQGILNAYNGAEMNILLMLNIYFIFLFMKNKYGDYEEILYYLSITLCILYIIQYIIYPKTIFLSAKVALEAHRGTSIDARFRVWGQCLAPLAFFMGLNKLLIKPQIKNYIQIALGLSVIIMMGFRTHVIFLMLFTFILLFKVYKMSLKSFLWLTGTCIFFWFVVLPLPFVQATLEKMIDRQLDGSSNLARWITMDFYMNHFFVNDWEKVFGAGLPGKTGAYQVYIDMLKQRDFIYADCGLLGLSWIAGIPAVLMIVIYPVISLIKNVPRNYYYIGITLGFCLFSSIFTREIFRDGNPLIFGILLAMQEKIINKYENRNTNVSLLS